MAYVYQKSQSYDKRSLRYGRETERIFFSFSPLMILKTKYLTKWKKSAWRYYRFTHVYYKWRSYDTWFLKYFLVNFGYFLPVQHYPPPPSPSLDDSYHQNFKKLKKNNWRYYHFTHVRHKWQSDDVWFFSECNMEHDGQNLLSFWTPDKYNFYFSFWAIFCSFTPPNDPKRQN